MRPFNPTLDCACRKKAPCMRVNLELTSCLPLMQDLRQARHLPTVHSKVSGPPKAGGFPLIGPAHHYHPHYCHNPPLASLPYSPQAQQALRHRFTTTQKQGICFFCWSWSQPLKQNTRKVSFPCDNHDISMKRGPEVRASPHLASALQNHGSLQGGKVGQAEWSTLGSGQWSLSANQQ